MKRVAALVLLTICVIGARLHAQTIAATPKAVAVGPKKKANKPSGQKENKPPANPFLGQSVSGLNSNEPTTTEIYSDEAFFDSTTNMGIFNGRVKVTDPRFNLQSDKLTVFITKGENQGLEKAVAEGNVGLVRDRPAANGGTPARAVGRADKATYTASTGDVELRGTPRVQEGPNMHVATSPDTVMIINQNSQLRTHGPSRTEIRQQPKQEQTQAEKDKVKKPESQAAPSQSIPAPTLPTP
jgi:lipopolysaccharide transport protein LptA